MYDKTKDEAYSPETRAKLVEEERMARLENLRRAPSDILFNPPTSIDRKYGGKHSEYRGGMPTGGGDSITSDIPFFLGEGQATLNPGTGEVSRGPVLPKGSEMPAMILRDEPGYEEDEPIV